jgi:hypothetical protein
MIREPAHSCGTPCPPPFEKNYSRRGRCSTPAELEMLETLTAWEIFFCKWAIAHFSFDIQLVTSSDSWQNCPKISHFLRILFPCLSRAGIPK